MNQYKNIRFQLEEMCVPQSVSPQSSLHSWVSSQLWSHSGPGGSLHGDSSHLRLPPLFLHEAGGRQQGEEGLGPEVSGLVTSWQQCIMLMSLQNSASVGESLLLGSHRDRRTGGLLRHGLCLDGYHRLLLLSALLHWTVPGGNGSLSRQRQNIWKICLCSENI